MKISCVLIAFNEEEKIAEAINSADFADEILVVDSESTDATRQIAESLGAKVIVQPWLGFSKQKQFAAAHAQYDWVLSLDADERISAPLRESILQVKKQGAGMNSAFRVARLTRYMGRNIRHCGWYPDWQVRLFDRNEGAWSDRVIHESFKVRAGALVGTLNGDLLHDSIDGPVHHQLMITERYAPLGAEQMALSGRRTGLANLIASGPVAFVQTYFLKLGFLDGLPGFIISKFAAQHAFLKHLYLFERQKRAEKSETTSDRDGTS